MFQFRGLQKYVFFNPKTIIDNTDIKFLPPYYTTYQRVKIRESIYFYDDLAKYSGFSIVQTRKSEYQFQIIYI